MDACITVWLYALCLQRPEEATWFPGAQDIGGVNNPMRWESNSGPLEDQEALLASEHLSSPRPMFWKHVFNWNHSFTECYEQPIWELNPGPMQEQ